MRTPQQSSAVSTPAAVPGAATPAVAPDASCRSALPIPDPVAIRLCPVPDSAPPYDDQPLPPHQVPPPAAEGNADATDACRVSFHAVDRLGFGEPPRRAGPRTDTRGRRGPGGANWPSQFAQALAETLAGARPPGHVAAWTTEQARASIRRLGPLLLTEQRPRLHRIVTSRPADDVIEVAAVVGFGTRTRAVAIRLERADARPPAPGRPGRPARWLCTAVESA